MILQPAKKKRMPEDDSFVGIRVGVLVLLAFVVFGILIFRLWYMQILTGDDYVASATGNRTRTVMVEAPRGVIYDRNGEPLVENRGGLSVGLLPMDMYDPNDQAAEFQAEIASLGKVLGMSTGDVLQGYKTAKKDPYMTRVLQEDVAEDTVVVYLEEHAEEFPGVIVEKTYLREYPNRALAAHLLGYVGEIDQKDLDEQAFVELKAGAHVGKNGVERQYDSYLRGTDGWKTVEVNAAGQPIDFITDVAAQPGNNLVLTIDKKLQQATEEALQEGIELAHAGDFGNAAGGAAVAIDPRTGEILAMASYPDFDPSVWVGGINQTDQDELYSEQANFPLFNRALNGLYPAGSTFKPFVAAVALNAGVITNDTTFDCYGKFKLLQQTWKCWTTKGHGNNINVLQALEQSCDIFFYNVGYKLYQEPHAPMQAGLREFGFGAKTGIDLPYETDGSRVPDKDWKRETGKTAEDKLWKPGDEINLAIGQGDLLVTPLQLAVACSAIANAAEPDEKDTGGTVWVPHVGLKITDSAGGVIHEFSKELNTSLEIDDDVLRTVRSGMRMVVDDSTGTANDAFYGFPISVAGKTGTAEKKPDDDYALFMGYAPADGNSIPEIVVIAVIEQGGHGSSVAAPVVRRIMEAYYKVPPGGKLPIDPTE
jgi:penicillin-binding protein 2